MKSSRFLFVAGVGRGPAAHPVWPDVYQQFQGDVDADGSWVAWRLSGANHRELGRSARVFSDLVEARLDALVMHDRIGDAQAQIVTIPNLSAWGWRLSLDGVVVATSSRSYARHRECTYNVEAFAAAAAVAELTDADPPRSWHLASPVAPVDSRVPGVAL